MSTRDDTHALVVRAPFEPAGDQPGAIDALVSAIEAGEQYVTLLGITGSGKSATMAWTLARLGRPALVLAPNKSLAAQLHQELSALLPDNAVEYFVSYYDYYQPEAYVVASDTFIEKEAQINAEIDRMRHAATSSALHRRDTILVASVSAIYGLGSPESYAAATLHLSPGQSIEISALSRRLVELEYRRNDLALERGRFRVRGDTLDVWPVYDDEPVRIAFDDDLVEQLSRVDHVTGQRIATLRSLTLYPASHYVSDEEGRTAACAAILAELEDRLAQLRDDKKLLEAQRLEQRTRRDVELLLTTGTCAGVENYSRHFDGRSPGEAPYTLLDYLDEDFVVVLDESHVTVPQIHGQQHADASRKATLIDHGFRLPSAADNRPLTGEEFFGRIGPCVFVSATPGPFEIEHASTTVQLLVRPTGLLDPVVEVRPTVGQVEDFVDHARAAIGEGHRVLATVLTKKMAEDLYAHLLGEGLRARYLHSDVPTLERIELLRDLRLGVFDILVGINLLREGLDLPEVALVSIFDADKQGFLRSTTSLIQTIGRAARNVAGTVVMYADSVTPAMRVAIEETNRRRAIQETHNETHGIVPRSVVKEISGVSASTETPEPQSGEPELGGTPEALASQIAIAEAEMLKAAEVLAFEEAARWRDRLVLLRARASSAD